MVLNIQAGVLSIDISLLAVITLSNVYNVVHQNGILHYSVMKSSHTYILFSTLLAFGYILRPQKAYISSLLDWYMFSIGIIVCNSRKDLVMITLPSCLHDLKTVLLFQKLWIYRGSK